MSGFFNGIRLDIPGAVSRIDSSALLQNALAQPFGTVAVIGSSDGGQPATPIHFTNPADAARTLRSGPLLDGVQRAFAPSGDTPGAGLVVAVRVDPAIQATLLLANVSGNSISLLSTDWGASTNLIAVKVEPGTTGTTKKLSIRKDTDPAIVQDNVGQPAISVKYGAGVGTAGTVTVTDTALTTASSDASAVLTLPFVTYTTLQSLVNALNAGGWVATIQHPNAAAPSAILDNVTGVSAQATPAILASDIDAQITWFNQYAGGYVTATRLPGAKTLSNMTSFAPLTGGSNGTIDSTSWAAALTPLENEDVHILVPMIGDATVHAQVQTHVDAMSASITGARERILVCGGIAGENVTQTVTRARGLNDPRAVLVYPGVLEADPLNPGATLIIAPYRVAAMVAGLIAGLGVADPITRRTLRSAGVSTKLVQGDKVTLLQNGVCPLELKPNKSVRIIQGLTTWTGDTDLSKREISVRRGADYTVKTVRESCDELLIGQRAGPDLVARATSVTDSALRAVRDTGVLVGDANNPAFRNIIVVLVLDTLRIDFDAAVAIPANYIFITAHLRPFQTA